MHANVLKKVNLSAVF